MVNRGPVRSWSLSYLSHPTWNYRIPMELSHPNGRMIKGRREKNVQVREGMGLEVRKSRIQWARNSTLGPACWKHTSALKTTNISNKEIIIIRSATTTALQWVISLKHFTFVFHFWVSIVQSQIIKWSEFSGLKISQKFPTNFSKMSPACPNCAQHNHVHPIYVRQNSVRQGCSQLHIHIHANQKKMWGWWFQTFN